MNIILLNQNQMMKKKDYERIKIDYENKKFEIIYEIQEKLDKINKIQEKGGISSEKNKPNGKETIGFFDSSQ